MTTLYQEDIIAQDAELTDISTQEVVLRQASLRQRL
jgi:hypothetical protein